MYPGSKRMLSHSGAAGCVAYPASCLPVCPLAVSMCCQSPRALTTRSERLRLGLLARCSYCTWGYVQVAMWPACRLWLPAVAVWTLGVAVWLCGACYACVHRYQVCLGAHNWSFAAQCTFGCLGVFFVLFVSCSFQIAVFTMDVAVVQCP